MPARKNKSCPNACGCPEDWELLSSHGSTDFFELRDFSVGSFGNGFGRNDFADSTVWQRPVEEDLTFLKHALKMDAKTRGTKSP